MASSVLRRWHLHASGAGVVVHSALVMGEDTPGDEVALSQEIAWTNAILIELASIQEMQCCQARLLSQQGGTQPL